MSAAGELRAGLAGAGPRAALHAVAASAAGVRVVAVGDAHRSAATSLASRLGAEVVPEAALADRAGLLVVTLTPSRRAAAANAALAAGAVVVVEPPLGATLSEADALVAAAGPDATRVLYAEAITYAPTTQSWLARVAALGPLTDLEVRLAQPRFAPAGRFEGASPGGALYELGVTAVALTVLAAAPARPLSVEAECRSSSAGDVDDDAEVRIRYDTGLVARVAVTHRTPHAPLWEVQAASATGVVRAELLPEPLLEVNGVAMSTAPPAGPAPELTSMGLMPMWRAFAHDASRRRRPVMDAAFGRAVLDVVCAAYAAAGRARAEPLPFRGDRSRLPVDGWRRPEGDAAVGG